MNTTPLFTVTPTFQLWVRFFRILPITLFLQVWATGFFGGIAYACLHTLHAKGSRYFKRFAKRSSSQFLV